MENSEHYDHVAVSRNVSQMQISAIKEMAILSANVEDAASLTWGVPSFPTPAYIRRAVATALERDPEIGKYALPDGLRELRKIVAEKHRQDTGIEVDPDGNVMITAGNMQGVNALLHVLVDPGDEIVVTDPGFASHFQQIRLCGGRPVYWQLDAGQGWSLNVDALPRLITPRTKAILLVTPSNPTGAIFDQESLVRVGALARQRGLLVLLDDPYSNIIYEKKADFFNLASRRELFDNLAYLFTFSKCYAMSGWRLGYMVVPQALKRQVLKVHDATIICTPRISQVAGIVALTQQSDHIPEFVAALNKRRELICRRLENVPHVFEGHKPAGAYYVFPRIVTEHGDSREFAMRLLREARVVVTPGAAFGPSGEHHVRMAYCVSEDVINKAFDRIEAQFPG